MNASDDFLASKVEEKTDINDLIKKIKDSKIPLKHKKIDINDFKDWCKEYYEIIDFYKNFGDVSIEKPLEHYITMKFLNLTKNDIFIDIASASSPWANILNNHLGNKAYSQDLVFKDGINGSKIGGDASNMFVCDNFADVLTLHCAFECFQGDSDINFIKETGRVLKKGGRLGIVPLYLDSIYFVKTGPRYDKRKVNIEKEARWIWRDDQWDNEPFSRHYSPEMLKKRIYDNINKLKVEIIHFTNLDEIIKEYPGQRIYCNFMFKAIKN